MAIIQNDYVSTSPTYCCPARNWQQLLSKYIVNSVGLGHYM